MTKKKIKNKYKATLNTGADTLKGEGETIYDAIGSLPVSWITVKLKAVLTVTDGTKEVTQRFNPRQFRRIHINKILKRAWSDKLQLLMKPAKVMNGR